MYKQPGPWKYWGYRPAPRPANTAAWARTDAIAQALDRALADPDRALRLAILQRMQREQVPVRVAALGQWLQDEHQPDRAAAILAALRNQPAVEIRKYLEPVIRDAGYTTRNRLAALALFVDGLAPSESLLTLAQALEDGPVLADVLRRLGRFPRLMAGAQLARHLKSTQAEVRAAAIEALGELRAEEGRAAVAPLLQDADLRVRRAAAGAAGKLGAQEAVEQLAKYATDADPALRLSSLDSLRLLRAPQVVPLAVAALGDRYLELKALECLAELGGPEQATAVAELAKRNPSADVPPAAVRILTAWRDRKELPPTQRDALDRAVAEIHGAGGIVVRWEAQGPDNAAKRIVIATGTEARVMLAKDGVWAAATYVAVAEPAEVEFLASSTGSLRVLLNGKQIHRRDQPRSFQIDSDRFAGQLVKGVNRLVVETGPGKAGVEFHLRFRRKSSSADHERLTQAALTRPGNPERGRKLMLNVEKSQCLKCHRLGEQGERIGPELTGIGSRFARIYLIESVLQPSRTIAPSFGTLVLSLQNGKVLTGVKVAESETTLTLADNQGQKHTVAKADIETQQSSPISAMPEGLERRFTEEEFVDLIAFLMSQKETR